MFILIQCIEKSILSLFTSTFNDNSDRHPIELCVLTGAMYGAERSM